MDRLTEQIATFVNALTFDDLSAEVAHTATQRLIDSLGCALGAHDCEPADIGRRLAAGHMPGKFVGRTLFANTTLPVETAAFINSTMIRNFDFNDRFPGGHPSDGLGAHLALAGASAIDGKRFLAAMVVTYEIFIRLSESSRLRSRGWDQGFAVAVSTAAGLCKLLGLSLQQTASAIGMTATTSVPLRVTRAGELTPWKNVATAFAVRNAVFAALLAAEGMVAPVTHSRVVMGCSITLPVHSNCRPFRMKGALFRFRGCYSSIGRSRPMASPLSGRRSICARR